MSTTRNTTHIDMLTEPCEIVDGKDTVVLTFPELDVKVRLDKTEVIDSTDLIRQAQAIDYCAAEMESAHEAGRAEARDEIDLGGVRRALEDWHNTSHESVLRFCYAEPCKTIRDALEQGE